ncbi:hypothetical protein HPB47_003373 [Ixodes persulcatus]|uniref:Uncharacterized protein n=1 Tax=Ixodes persulcatus TaxID=34615 RepID=A0AC60PIN5_IXOPE|nr:hypothetical protein HPB47_003373 [Ixodes persulcatus]
MVVIVLFGKSSCPELVTEVYTSVTYHSKSPDFQDEVKVKLPARLTDRHHLFFTFYHISCQRKMEQTPTETPIGYTWFPLYHDGHLQTGDHVLPVMLEHPPASYSFLTPSVQIPNTKWVDGHKGLFDVSLHAASTVHPQVPPFPSFLAAHFVSVARSTLAIQSQYSQSQGQLGVLTFINLGTRTWTASCSCAQAVEGGHVPPRLLNGETAETELRASLLELVRCRPGPLVRFLPTVLDALVRMLGAAPPPGRPALQPGPGRIPRPGCRRLTPSPISRPGTWKIGVPTTPRRGCPRTLTRTLLQLTLEKLATKTLQKQDQLGTPQLVIPRLHQKQKAGIIQNKLLEDQNDQHGRNALLATYVQYQCTLPHPDPYLPSPSGDSPLLAANVYGTIGRASSAVPILCETKPVDILPTPPFK